MSENTYHHRILTARERYLDHGETPTGLVPEPIHRSWERCLKQGLSVNLQPELDLANNTLLSELKEKNALLIHQSQTEMENLFAHISGTQSMVILSDAQGTILNAMGDPSFMSKAARVALQPGVSWREEITGTNAIGTALIEKTPVFVKGAEHYFERNAFLNCSAAPIQDPQGRTIGVLDLSGDHRQPYEHTMALVRMSAQMIENRLFKELFNQDLMLRFHTRPEFIGTLWEGIAAFSDDGKLLATNKSGQFQLGLDSQDILGKPFDSIFDASFNAFIDATRQQSPAHSIQLKNGLHLHVRLDKPFFKISAKLSKTQDPISPKAVQLPLDQLDTGDEKMKETIRKAKLALNHNIAILIEGETGTGKELLAKAIHDSGPRKQGAFVAINCAAIPDGLIESELFGHEEGAFTGAKRRGAIGRIQQAHGGTLFLDEIGEMPLSLQARLLRVIQEREVVPLGSHKTFKVDIAVISASNNKLKERVKQGFFREDLYYRINGLRLTLPALRERNDISTLMHNILHKTLGLTHASFHPQVLELMQQHPWHGNIRQLHHVIQVATIFMQGSQLKLEHLPEDFLEERTISTRVNHSNSADIASILVTQGNMAKHQDNLIQEALTLHNGNMTAAASHLGISRATVYRKAKKLGLR